MLKPANDSASVVDRLRARCSSAVVLFAIAFVVRIAYVLAAGRQTGFELDRAGYILAKHGAIRNVLGPFSGPSAHLVPLPVMLRAAIEWSFGPGTQTSWLVAAALACAFSAWAIALLPRLARKLQLSETAGLVTAVILALHPFRLWGDSEPGHETSLVTLTLVGIILTFVDVRASGWQDRHALARFSVLCGMAALLSQPVLLVGLALVALDFVTAKSVRMRVAAGGLIVVAVVALAVSPWVLRNYGLFGEFIPFRSNFGLELHLGNNPTADGRTYSRSFKTMHPFIYLPERDVLKQLGEPVYMHEKLERAKQWIREHPRDFTRLCLRRMQLLWFLPSEMWDDGRSPVRAWPRSLWYGVVGLLALLEILRLVWLRHRSLPLILVVIVAYSSVYWITHVDARYAQPLDWLRTLLAVQLVFTLISGFPARFATPEKSAARFVG